VRERHRGEERGRDRFAPDHDLASIEPVAERAPERAEDPRDAEGEQQ
jgi:hypothetical protein